MGRWTQSPQSARPGWPSSRRIADPPSPVSPGSSQGAQERPLWPGSSLSTLKPLRVGSLAFLSSKVIPTSCHFYKVTQQCKHKTEVVSSNPRGCTDPERQGVFTFLHGKPPFRAQSPPRLYFSTSEGQHPRSNASESVKSMVISLHGAELSVGDGLWTTQRHSEVEWGVEEVHGLLTVGVPAAVPLQRKQQEGSEASGCPSQPPPGQAFQPRQPGEKLLLFGAGQPRTLRSHYPEHLYTCRRDGPRLSGSANSGPEHSTTSSSAGFRRPVLTVLSVVR